MTAYKHRPVGCREYTRPFTEAELRAAYVDERLSMNEIKKRFDCAHKTVRRALVEYGIQIEARTSEAMVRSYERARARCPVDPVAKAAERSSRSVWHSMKSRCYEPEASHFDRYGGRGITVCQRWLDSFEAFSEDMGPRPSKATIERKDNDGNYEPRNCRWATRKEQSNNTRRNRFVVLNGERLTLKQLSERSGLGYYGLRGRLERGMSVEAAIAHPMREAKKRKSLTHDEIEIVKRRTHDGVSQVQIAKELGCHSSHICRTIKRLASK